jgi:hypothetical protein
MNVIVTVSCGKESIYVKTFTIDTHNNITVHTARKAARETGAGVFATGEQFADLIVPDKRRLVEIWNGLAGVKPVTKFANRKAATDRIWKAIQSLGQKSAAPVSETPFDRPEAHSAPTELPVADPKLAEPETERPQEDSILQAEIEPVVLTAPDGTEPAANVGAQEAQVAPAEETTSEKTRPSKTAPNSKRAAKPAKSEESAAR